jgi:predicted transcriptional regulator
MSVAELQKKIIEKISETNDAALLEDIFNFIGIDEAVGTFYELSDSQLAAIEQSQQQIKDGHYFTNEEANKEIDEWIKK